MGDTCPPPEACQGCGVGGSPHTMGDPTPCSLLPPRLDSMILKVFSKLTNCSDSLPAGRGSPLGPDPTALGAPRTRARAKSEPPPPAPCSLPAPSPRWAAGGLGAGCWQQTLASALPSLVKRGGTSGQALPPPASPNGSTVPRRERSQTFPTSPRNNPHPRARAATSGAPACPDTRGQTHSGSSLRRPAGTRLGTSTQGNFEAPRRCSRREEAARGPQRRAGRERGAAPHRAALAAAAPGPAEPRQAPTRRAEPTRSEPRARLRASSADPGREKGADPGKGGAGGQVGAQPGFGGRRQL